MISLKTKTALTLALLAAATGISAVHAAPVSRDAMDLPILVDRYYEIKDPAGPVTTVVPEELKGPRILSVVPEWDLKDMPNPQEFEQVLIGL